MKDKQSLNKRNQEILDEISEMLVEKSSRGSQKYTAGYIYDIVGERHDLQSRTVRNIFCYPAADADICPITDPIGEDLAKNSSAAL